MFGYVTVYKPELKIKDFNQYKSYYCGLCRTLKEDFGFTGQMTLSYDMTFLVVLLTSLYESETKSIEKRCKTHPIKKQPMLVNEISRYGAKMNVLLSYYHFLDDWHDEKSVKGLAAYKVMKKKAKKIAKAYPRQAKVIKESLKELARLESENCQNIDQVAGQFGNLMADLIVYKQDPWEGTLRRLGFFLGKFIYIMDAWDDLDKDIKKDSYNPLKNFYKEHTEKEYNQICYDMMEMMMAETSSAFELLPCVQDVDILRNIIYAGVWTKYNTKLAQQAKEKNNG